MNIKDQLFSAFLWLAVLAALLSAACAEQSHVRAQGDTLVFSYTDATAHEIMFASSIDQYQYHPAIKSKHGRWEVTVPLRNEFTYFYIVDGKITLPDCPITVTDDFGGRNCLYVHPL